MIIIKENSFVIENDFLRREIIFDSICGLSTISLINKQTGREYAKTSRVCEFLLGLNGRTLFGYEEPHVHELDGNVPCKDYTLQMVSADSFQRTPRHECLRLTLKVVEIDVVLTLFYELYLKAPGMTKWIEVSSCADNVHLEQFYFEILNAYPGLLKNVDFYTYQGLQQENKFFVTNDADDVIQVHNPELEEGFFLGNSAPGPLKRFMIYPHWSGTALSIGYNSDKVPFHKYLNAGESFTSHKAYLYAYNGGKNDSRIRNRVRDFLREDLPPCTQKGLFMYCTWIPFLKDINEALLLELIEQTATLGFTTFVVDDGWFQEGDWQVDRQKFPNGLQVVSQKAKTLGMTFGLWFNIGTDYGVAGTYPEDNAVAGTGGFKRHGFSSNTSVRCLASGHRERITAKLKELARQYDVGYFKLDFSSIISPYGFLPVGCHSHDHAHHRDSADAVVEQYASLKFIRDDIKAEFPNLVIDFSFEAFGADRPHIAALQHSELHHVTNMNTRNEGFASARDIRNALYNYATILPVERILGSLICLQGPDALENLLTALIGAPLLAGDVRTLSGEQREAVCKIIAAVQRITEEAPLTEFIKLHGDDRVSKHDWDGFVRLTRSGEALVCLFRNQSQDYPLLRLDHLPEDGQFLLKDILSGETLGLLTAESLRTGIVIPWPESASCRALEIIWTS